MKHSKTLNKSSRTKSDKSVHLYYLCGFENDLIDFRNKDYTEGVDNAINMKSFRNQAEADSFLEGIYTALGRDEIEFISKDYFNKFIFSIQEKS